MNQTIILCGSSSIIDSEFCRLFDASKVSFTNVSPDSLVVDCENEKMSRGCLIMGESVSSSEAIRVLEQLLLVESCLVPVVVVDNPTIAFVVRTMRLGALSVVPASESRESLKTIVDEAIDLSSQRLSEVSRHKEIVSRIDKLSARQKEVMAYVVDGASNKTIAAELHLSPKTIEVHRASVMRKMKARSLPDLVKFSLSQFTKPHSAIGLTSPISAVLPMSKVFAG